MRPPRVQLVELEDLPWFPVTIRDLATDYLEFMQAKLRLHKPLVPLLADALQRCRAVTAVDLCSGGGGPVVALHAALADAGVEIRYILTDLYPNRPALDQAVARAPTGGIAFASTAVDARSVPDTLVGFRTLFNSFHHFGPQDAKAVLADAVRTGQGIGIFEIPERTFRALVPFVFLTPLVVLLTAPFIRPFRWSRLLFTYLVPLVPLTCWWDGIVSHLRAYTTAELAALGEAVGAVGYVWEVGSVRIPRTPSSITYLIGTPRSAT